MKLLSIIIVAYKAKDYLQACLESLPQHRNWETIVIDNSQVNLGFTKACNQGAQLAKGKYLFFLNPDTVVKAGAIETLLTAIEADKKIGIIGPQLLDESGVPYISATRQPTRASAPVVYSILNDWFKDNPISRDYWYGKTLPKKEKTVGSVSGAALLIAKEDFEQLGGFDESMFMYWEDFDLCRRLEVMGKRVVYYPQAQVIHAREKSTTRESTWTRTIFRDSRYRFFKKHFGFLYAVGLEGWLTFQEEWRLWVVLSLSIYLRFDRLWQLMPLNADQGRDYLAALESVKTNTLPLLGIPSSLPQFSQGPLYIWWLTGIFKVFGPSALAAGYAAAATGVATVFLAYRIAEKWWNRRVATIASLILATAPLAVAQARMAFMTNPLPLATLWFLWRLQKPLRTAGDWWWLTFSFALLFQFELAVFPLLLLVVYKGFSNRKAFVMGWKGMLGGFTIGLLPQILFDVTHGFRQMGLFAGWVAYRLVRFWGVIPGKQSGWGQLSGAVASIGTYLTKFAGWDKPLFTLILGLIVVVGGFILVKRRWQSRITYPYLMIGLILIAYIVHGAPSEAYFPVLFVPLSWAIGWTVDQFKPGLRFLLMAIILAIAISNTLTLVGKDYYVYSARNLQQGLDLPYGAPLQSQIRVVNTLIHLTGHQPLSLRTIGPGSEFPTYLDSFRFLLVAQGVLVTDTGRPVWFIFGQREPFPVVPNAKTYTVEGITLAVGL